MKILVLGSGAREKVICEKLGTKHEISVFNVPNFLDISTDRYSLNTVCFFFLASKKGVAVFILLGSSFGISSHIVPSTSIK